jgi:hypothetical protein
MLPDRRWPRLVISIVLSLAVLAAALIVVRAPLFDLDRFLLPKELVLHLAAAVTGVVIVLGRDEHAVTTIDILLAALLGLSVLSALLATNHWLAFRTVAMTLSGIVVFRAARLVSNTEHLPVLLGGLALAVTIGALTGVAQAYGWTTELLAASRAPGGTFGNRNFLAHFVVLGLPVLLFTATQSRTTIGRLGGSIGVAIACGAVVLSRSRAAWVGAVGCLGVTSVALLMARNTVALLLDRARLRLVGAAAALGIVAALLLPNRLEWKSPSPYRDSLRDVLNYREGSGRGRLIQYRNSINLIRLDPLLGAGPGNWPVAYPLVTTPGDPSFNAADPIPTNPWPSSDWVALLAERGPMTLALAALLGIALGIVLVRRLRSDDPALALRCAVGLGLLTALVLEGAFDAVLLLAPPTLLAAAGLGGLLPELRPVRTLILTGARRRRWLLGFGAVYLVILARTGAHVAALVKAQTGQTTALLEAVRWDPGNYRLELYLAQRLPCRQAVEHAERARRLFPNHTAPRELLARCGGR